MIIDAEGKILGRMASRASEKLRAGEEVTIINAEKAEVSGKEEDVYSRYRKKRDIGNRDHGPRFPKSPDRIVKRTVRGMLPNNAEGREAFKRLKVYSGNPKGLDPEEVRVKGGQELKNRRYVTVEQISRNIG